MHFISHIEKASFVTLSALLLRCSTNQIQELALTALYNSLLLIQTHSSLTCSFYCYMIGKHQHLFMESSCLAFKLLPDQPAAFFFFFFTNSWMFMCAAEANTPAACLMTHGSNGGVFRVLVPKGSWKY